jgi:predicted kinase
MLIGVPASGKSTWIKSQSWPDNTVVVSTDRFVEEYAEKQGKTYSEVFDEYMPIAVRLMANQVLVAKANKCDIIWDQTSTTVATRAKKFKMLPDYEAIAVVFKTPEKEEHDRRLNSREGKNIPAHVMKNMIDNYEPPTKEEGFSDIRYV